MNMYNLNIGNDTEVDQNSVLVQVFCVVVHARILKILQQLLPLLSVIIVIKLKQAEWPFSFGDVAPMTTFDPSKFVL